MNKDALMRKKQTLLYYSQSIANRRKCTRITHLAIITDQHCEKKTAVVFLIVANETVETASTTTTKKRTWMSCE